MNSTPEPVPDALVTTAPNKGGAPAGNRNSIRSGLKSFVIGRFPPGCSYIARQAHLLRRQLRAAVTAQDGATTVWSESVISSACTHEARRLLLQRWLREADASKSTTKAMKENGRAVSITEKSGLGIMERASILDRISAATDARDRCIRQLGLDQSRNEPWAFLTQAALPESCPAPVLSPGCTQSASDDTQAIPNSRPAKVIVARPPTNGESLHDFEGGDE